jgi:D-glycerate 3-kinase
MTDLQVREFVDGYMPAYELYLEHLRKRADLRIVLSKSRKVVSKQIAASL